jgi:hypothetical protein
MELLDTVLPGMLMAFFAFCFLALVIMRCLIDVAGFEQENVTPFGLQVSF